MTAGAGAGAGAAEEAAGNQRLAILLSMAMFVLVVDTSLMNVSISAVVDDLDTTVSGVQSAIALEALVSAAFILIGSKVGDLIGRKRAYVLGLLGYAIGALAMALAQSLTASHHLLGGGRRARSVAAAARDAVAHPRQLRRAPRRRRRTPWSGRRPRSPPRSGRCSAGSSRPTCRGGSRSCSRTSIIVIVLSGIKLVRDVPYTGPRQRRRRRRGALGPGHGRHRARHPRVAGRRRGRRRAAGARRGRAWPRWSTGWCGASAEESRR